MITSLLPSRFNGWAHKALIQITNPVSLANYQHRLDLSWLPGMADDFRDIRITQVDGTPCSYWIESYTARISAVIWIKVPTAGQTSLKMIFGNDQVNSESNGNTVFEFFDEFAVYDTTSKWTTVTGSPSASEGILNIPSGGNISSKSNFPVNTVVEIRCSYDTIANYMAVGVQDTAYYGALFYVSRPTSGVLNAVTRNPSPSESAQNLGSGYTGYHIFEIQRNGSTSVIFRIDRATVATITTNVPTGSLPIGVYGQAQSISVDWVLIRKYAATEPVLSILTHCPNTGLLPYTIMSPTGRSFGTIIW